MPFTSTRTPIARRLRVDDVLHPVLAGDHELLQVSTDAHVAVAGAGVGRSGERRVGEALFQRHVERNQQLIRGNGSTEDGGNHQTPDAEAGHRQEMTSPHDVASKAASTVTSRSQEPAGGIAGGNYPLGEWPVNIP